MIDDDILALQRETLSRSELLARLHREPVLVPTHAPPSDGRADLILLKVPDEDGPLLPVFTSREYLTRTPVEPENVLELPFEDLAAILRPDIGIVLNPDSDRSYLFRWFVLQELLADLGRNYVKQEVTDAWLAATNEKFSRDGLAAEKRPLEALREWSEVNGTPLTWSAPRAKRIFEWFATNLRSDLYSIGPITSAVYFYDTVFWEVTIPLVLGAPPMNPLDMLKMPDATKRRFAGESNNLYVYLKFFADTYDYFYSILDIGDSLAPDPFLQGFVAAGREKIKASASYLLERRPNSKSAEESRYALEMFLKTYLIKHLAYDEPRIRTFSHDLRSLLKACLQHEPTSELRHLESKVDLFPPVAARYRHDDIPPQDLWTMYYATQTAGAIVLRPFSDRDSSRGMTVAW